MFFLFPTAQVAHAAVVGLSYCNPPTTRIDTIICRIGSYIIDPLIALLMTLALVLFIWGVIQFLVNQNNGEEAKIADGKRHMIWGIVGLVIMVSVYGLMALISRTFDLKNSQNQKIENQIPKSQNFGRQL